MIKQLARSRSETQPGTSSIIKTEFLNINTNIKNICDYKEGLYTTYLHNKYSSFSLSK